MKKFDPALIAIVPLLGIVGGGYLSLPVTSLLKCRQPWTSIGLVLGLVGVLSFCGICILGASLMTVAIAAIAGVTAYLVMASFSGFRQHIEPFFAAHMLGFMALLVVSSIQNKSQAAALQPLPALELSARLCSL